MPIGSQIQYNGDSVTHTKSGISNNNNNNKIIDSAIDSTITDPSLKSVKEKAARFENLTKEFESDRKTANHVERFKIREEDVRQKENYHETMEDPQLVINRKTEMNVDQQRVVSEKIEQTQRNYFPGRGPEVQHYVQETPPQIQQDSSYTVRYSSSSAPNGHHETDDTSSGGGSGTVGGMNNQNSSQLSSAGMSGVDNAQLISRTTQQLKTQQVKTITKVYTSREVRHIGPDGQPIEYNPYGTLGAPPAPPSSTGGDYSGYAPSEHLDHYGNYDQHFASANGSAGYGMPPSPGAGSGSTTTASAIAQQNRLYDPYSRNNQVGYQLDYHNYQDYPLNTSTPPSIMSESPPPIRRSSLGQVMNHIPQSGYDELDTTFQYQQQPHHSPYGYAPGPQNQMHSPGGGVYHYDPTPPQGYLDRRPSYDDHDHATYSGSIHGPPPTVFEEDESAYPGNVPVVRQGFPMDQLVAPDGSLGDIRWRDPDLHEVIEFLSHPNNIVRANAAAYLQHLCFMDDNMKSKTRSLGGIQPLINLLTQEVPEIQRNACGALRNLSYGRQNDENKRAIRAAGGIPSLVRLLRKSVDNEIRELVTGVLWNLSSCEDLKRPIIDDALIVLVNVIIIPHSGWDRFIDPSLPPPSGVPGASGEIYWSTVFRNASGVLRNISSAGEYARRKLRECDGLVDALLYLVRAAIGKNEIDNKSVENCVCILRNLSYRCQEVIDPEYDKHYYANQNNSLSPSSSSRASAIMGGIGNKVGDNLGCFGASKKKSKETISNISSPLATTPINVNYIDAKTQQLTVSGANTSGNSTLTPTSPPVQRPRSEPARGMELLWQTEVVQPYLALLSDCSNPETLEAAAGAIQNLAACFWQPSIDIRGAVRKEKGLPILVELLRMEVDRVVCAVATALRNLAMDTRNKELIGKYALKDLVLKLPNGNPQHDAMASDDTVAAVLATLNEVIAKNPDFAKSLIESGGMERLTIIVKQKAKFSPRVFKFTSQLLFNMWQHVELREVYRKSGWKESHFLISRTLLSRTSSSSNSPSANNTLMRPMSTVGSTRYEDRTLPRSAVRDMSQIHVRPEELALTDMNHGDGVLSPNQQPLLHRPPIGGVPIYPPGATYIRGPTSEPVYAQVNRERKKQQSRPNDTSSQTALLGSDSYILDHNEPIYPPSMPAGDSWV